MVLKANNVFSYVKVRIFWKRIQYTIHWDKTMLRKFHLDKINGTKHALLFFFCKLQLITALFLICNSYMSWNTRFVSLKLCGIFHLRFCFIFIKVYILLQQNAWTPFKIKAIQKPHIVLLPDLWFLSWNKKFENSMVSVWVGAPQKLTWW